MIKFIQDEATGSQLRVNDFDLFDADQAIFFARQLEHLKARSYDVKYAQLRFREAYAISNEGGPGPKTITYWTYDQTGMSQFIGSYAQDLPRADVGGKETIIRVKDLGISVGWTTSEIRSAAKAGLSLDARKMNAAVRGNEQTLNRVAWFGDAEAGLEGLMSHPNIPRANVVNGGGGNPEFITKTPDEILFDLHDMCNDIFVDTKQVERPNKVLMPTAQWAYISTTRVSTLTQVTILQSFVANSPWIASVEDVMAINELAGAGTGGVDVMVAYDNSPDIAQFEIPMELTFHPEQLKGLEILVPAECSTGGLNVYYPTAFMIRESI